VDGVNIGKGEGDVGVDGEDDQQDKCESWIAVSSSALLNSFTSHHLFTALRGHLAGRVFEGVRERAR
jgi:hypothetical protein